MSGNPGVSADLTAPRWKLTARGIQIEDKIEIRKRIGRSPDVGDAIVMAWSTGQGALREQIINPFGRPSRGCGSETRRRTGSSMSTVA
jgi:hypothetical protein